MTTILLLRVRYLLHQADQAPLLSEEVLATAYCTGKRGTVEWLEDAEALRLLADARPDANLPMAEKRELISDTLNRCQPLRYRRQVKGGIGVSVGPQRRVLLR